MLKQNYKIVSFSISICDVFLTLAALYSAYHIRFYSRSFTKIVALEHDIPPLSDYLNWKFILTICIIWPFIFRVNRMYKAKRGLPLFDLILSIISSVTLSTTFFLVLTFFFRTVREGVTVSYSRAMIVSFWSLNILYILIFRLLLRWFSRHLRRKGYNQRHILIAGAGMLGQLFLSKLRTMPEMGFRVEGFIDDDPEKQWTVINGVSVLGTLDDAPELIRQHGIEQVFTALPLSAHRRIYTLLSQIQNECVDIFLIPDILQYITLRAGFQNMDGIPVINLTETPLSGYNLIIKRAFDLFVAAGLIFFNIAGAAFDSSVDKTDIARTYTLLAASYGSGFKALQNIEIPINACQ